MLDWDGNEKTTGISSYSFTRESLSTKWPMFKIEIANRFNHTNGVTVLTTTDRQKLARNRCVIEDFGVVFCIVSFLFGFYCRCRGLCHRTECIRV